LELLTCLETSLAKLLGKSASHHPHMPLVPAFFSFGARRGFGFVPHVIFWLIHAESQELAFAR
jgi:fucose permease